MVIVIKACFLEGRPACACQHAEGRAVSEPEATLTAADDLRDLVDLAVLGRRARPPPCKTATLRLTFALLPRRGPPLST